MPEVIVSSYEVVENLPGEVKRIAEHLNINISLDGCQKIAAEYTVDIQKKRVEQFKEKLLQMPYIYDNKDKKFVDYHDEESLLHINHIDSDKVGKWKEELSVKEVAMIENKVRDWCRENEYEPCRFLRRCS